MVGVVSEPVPPELEEPEELPLELPLVPLLVPVSEPVPPVLLEPLLEPLGAVLLPLLLGAVVEPLFCSVPELVLGLIELVWLLWILEPELELYCSDVPPWFRLEAQPAATKPASAITASIFFIISPFTSFRKLAPAQKGLNRAFTRFVAQDCPQ